MNAQEITIILNYWKDKEDKKEIAYYQQKLEQYQKDQERD